MKGSMERDFRQGLEGDKIPLLSQIIHVCEQYDMLSRMPQGESQGCHQYTIDELEKGRDRLFLSNLLDIAIPVLQVWGPRDISWMRDLKNVHAFFTSDPVDGVVLGQREPVSVPAPGEDLDNSFVPRRWERAELGEDFVLHTGGDGLENLTGIEDVRNFFDIIDPCLAEKAGRT
ncbi:hypothetical protein HNV12_12450 [Methanococcoides sp. SA1]|nr:hypothetical protein [Methanococcoides sp. SA1]